MLLCFHTEKLLTCVPALPVLPVTTPEVPKPLETPDIPNNAEVSKKMQVSDAGPVCEVNHTTGATNSHSLHSQKTKEFTETVPHNAADHQMPVFTKETESEPHEPIEAVVQEAFKPAPQTPQLPLSKPEASLGQPIADAVAEGSESPPYEPSLDNVRNGSESPPYEPSLGHQGGVDEDIGEKMDIAESDAEDGEILEESVDMEVDSGDDDTMQDIVFTTPATTRSEALEAQGAPHGLHSPEEKHMSDTLISSTYQATTLPQKPPSPVSTSTPALQQVELSRSSILTAVTNEHRKRSNAAAVSDVKVSSSYPVHIVLTD